MDEIICSTAVHDGKLQVPGKKDQHSISDIVAAPFCFIVPRQLGSAAFLFKE